MFGLAGRLLGQDSKLDFRKPGAGASLLAGKSIARDETYWTQYWTLFDSQTDVITLLDSHSITVALTQNPDNIITLIEVLSNHLFDLLSIPSFPLSASPSNSSSRHSSTGAWTEGIRKNLGIDGGPEARGERDLTRETLNCIRVLNRVIPFVIRPHFGAEREPLEEQIFWTEAKVKLEKTPPAVPEKKNEIINVSGDEGGQFVIDDEGDEDLEDAASERTENVANAKKLPGLEEAEVDVFHTVPPLAERLLSALVNLLFVPGLTIPEECRTEEGCVSYVIWEPGIANPSTTMPPTSQLYLSSRLEILRLLVLLLSLPSLLTSPHNFPYLTNRWRETLVGSETLEKKVVLCLLCSVLNTAFASGRRPIVPNQSAFTIGTAIGAAEKFGGAVLRKEDVRGLLVGSCLHLLEILLAEHAPASPPAPGATSPIRLVDPSTSLPESASPIPNTFVFYASKLHRPSDFDFIVDGVLSILSQGLNQSLIPGVGSLGPVSNSTSAGGKTGWASEAIIVLWRVIEHNPKCLSYFVETNRAAELLTYLLAFSLEYKDDDTQIGIVRLCAFFMQSLSAERGLGIKLNSPVDLKPALRARYNVPGCLADFLIVSICTLVFTTKARLATLYPALVLTITNSSPYLKNLSLVSATKLSQLFLAFSAPSFLLSEEGNPRLVYYLLEVFNNIIQYQIKENPCVLYSLIKSNKRFEDLSTFTLAGAVAEVRKIRADRKGTQGKVQQFNRRHSITVPQPLPVIKHLTAPAAKKEPKEESLDLNENEKKDTPLSPGVSHDELPPQAGNTEEKVRSQEGLDDVSTKRAGKMKERTLSISSIVDLTLGRAANEEGVFVGKNGFVPTEGWVSSWRDGLPLDTIMIMISELQPKILQLSDATEDREKALAVLRDADLSGLLPSPPAIRPRRFIFTTQSVTWLASLIYGGVYLTSLELLRDVPVQLFAVAHARRGATATDIVSGAANFVISKVGSRGNAASKASQPLAPPR